jgi:hypothetical protein
MEGERDPFDYLLAEALGGMTVAEMRDRMSNHEYLEWRAFFKYRAAQQKLAADTAAARAARGRR